MRLRNVLFASVAVVTLATACVDPDATPTDPTGVMPGGDLATVQVYLVDQERFNVGEAPYVTPVMREVPADDPVQGALDALFDGPTTEEANRALILVASGATGATVEEPEAGIARVRLAGGCNSGGSTLTIASQLIPTLKQFDEIEVVKILDPDGATNVPEGNLDSIPACLEP
jgi:hypothetical protein